jgi:hypothetical protein
VSTRLVCFESSGVISFIERTFTEAAEQTPRPRAGSAQAAGATNDHALVAFADGRSPTRAGGFVFAEPIGSRATSIRAVAVPRTPETYA